MFAFLHKAAGRVGDWFGGGGGPPSGNQDDRPAAPAPDPAGVAVARLHAAMDGLGTDEGGMREALAGVTNPAQAREIRDRYRRQYGVDLDAEIDSELSGKEKHDIQLMLPKQPGPMFGTPEFEAALDKATGSKAHEGNTVTPLFDGVNSFAERQKLVEGATSSINMQTFVFTDDETGWSTALQLAEKAQQGVKVRFMYDVIGSGLAFGSPIFEFMRKAGVEVRAYGNPLEDPTSLNTRWHEKHIIVDGQTSIEGGMNVADEYALGGGDKKMPNGGEGWRDADIEVQGPMVKDAQQAFLNNWNQLGAPVEGDEANALLNAPAGVEGGSSARLVQHKAKRGDDHIEDMYLQCVRSSTESITIENAYFIPSEALRVELMAAAKRGVKVRVMTNSRQSNDAGFVADASRFFDDELVAAGVEMHERDGSTIHAKTASFDGKYAIMGSANLNGRSREHDAETVVGVSDPRVASQLEKRFEAGLPQTKPADDEALRKDSTWDNVRQGAMSLFSDIF